MSDMNDGDSQMQSSPSGSEPGDSDNDMFPDEYEAPIDSTTATANPSAMSIDPTPNVNGKRPLSGESSGADSAVGATTLARGASTLIDPSASAPPSLPQTTITSQGGSGTKSHGQTYEKPQVHDPSGYTWTKDEDAPGYAWENRKAQEEAAKAWEQIQNKEDFIGNRYGDLLNDEE